jgi:hypothetical protein
VLLPINFHTCLRARSRCAELFEFRARARAFVLCHTSSVLLRGSPQSRMESTCVALVAWMASHDTEMLRWHGRSKHLLLMQTKLWRRRIVIVIMITETIQQRRWRRQLHENKGSAKFHF